jgi:L-amino acid N-acyltransferase YncA
MTGTQRPALDDFAVRPVRLGDAEAIVRILNPIIEAGAYTVLDRTLTAEEQRAFIEGFPSRGVFHVAESAKAGTVLGLQDVEPIAGYTKAFDHVGSIATYVDLAARRCGVGAALAEATFAAAREKGFEKLFSYVRADNPDALAYYRKMGFTVVGTADRQARIQGAYIDEVVIEKWLGS